MTAPHSLAALAAVSLSAVSASAMSARIVGPLVVEPGTPCAAGVAVTNTTEQAITARIVYRLQRNSQNREVSSPDPRHGADHAAGCKSWVEVDGERVEDASLTDGSPHFGHDSSRTYKEAFHFVDLGMVRKVSHLAFQSGDANWIWRWDIAASQDGVAYEPVEGLQNIDMHKQWGRRSIAVPAPFEARFLRLRYHKDGEELRFLRTPVMLQVYDGASPDEFDFPEVGESIEQGSLDVAVPPLSEVTVPLGCKAPLATGAYLLTVRLDLDEHRQLVSEPVFGLPPVIEEMPEDSQFGMNGASFEYSGINRRLGVKWMRFENMKWNMSMPGPDRYAFDGSVSPWNVRHDDYMKMHQALGMKVLPYTFQTPRFLSRAPEGTTRNVHGHPPKDFADYGDMMFQLAARYGSVKHPETVLKSDDKQSGLGLIDTYQLWNEPNLEGPDWAPWVGTMDEFMEIFRIGAEAVKRADPAALVTPAGFAGIAVSTVDSLYRYQYADGKRPVDFADILSVHYYSGRQEPEIATLDRNATRSGQAAPGDPTYPESLARLIDWRDDHAPGKPIWITETGNDVGGVMGLGEREQGGKIPRVTMLALAAGIDKVFIYRERGSTPAQHAGAGLMRNDDTYRPSYFTFATLVRQFIGVKPGRAWRIEHPSPDVWIHVWERNGEPLVTAWSIGEEVALGLDLGECEVVDAFGTATRRDAASLVLGYYPQYIGGIAKPEALVPLVEASKAREAARQAERLRDQQRRTVLFDFGSRQHVGSLILGGIRRYQPVMSEDEYDAERGWGLEPRPGARDNSAHWIADALRKDSVRLTRGHSFRFRAEQGTYRVTVLAQPVGGPTKLTLHAGDETRQFAVVKDAEAESVVLAVAGGDLVLRAEAHVELQAISLVEEA